MSDEERRMAAESGSPPTTDSEERSRKVPSWLAVFAAFLGAVVGVIVARLVLVGFVGMFDFAGKPVWDYRFAGKTVWNYLDVFLVPVAVGLVTVWLTLWENRRQLKYEALQKRLQEQAEDIRKERELEIENKRADAERELAKQRTG
jgi:type VI protein secretion system component VasK